MKAWLWRVHVTEVLNGAEDVRCRVDTSWGMREKNSPGELHELCHYRPLELDEGSPQTVWGTSHAGPTFWQSLLTEDILTCEITGGNNEINNGWIPWTATVLGLVHCHTVMAYWHTWIEQSHIIVNRSYLCFSEYEKSKYLLWKKFSMSKTISILLHSNVANDHLTFHSTGNQRWKSFLL